MDPTRREFLSQGSIAAAGAVAAATPVIAAPDKDPHGAHHAGEQPAGTDPSPKEEDRGKLRSGRRSASDAPLLVTTPDLEKLPWTMKDGAKEFHLRCTPTRREFLPDMDFHVWGFNDSMPGPTIEVVEGDRVRIVVHNELPESTSLHWHGLEVPIAMDGVHGLTQDPIPPGGMFIYEFDLHQNGTFFYHSHGPMQEGMGMVGLFIIHPKVAHSPAVDQDFALLIQEWAILPGASIPNTMSMEFNFFTLNGRSAPYITPLVVRLGDRVRIRFVNMSPIDHHPMHIHGNTFWVTGTEGGRIPESAWIPGNNVLVGVAQARDVEFVASNPGDWMIHCHMFHHMMNHMTSMVGPMTMTPESMRSMPGHKSDAGDRTRLEAERRDMPAGLDMQPSLGMLLRGPALSEEHGPALGRGLGEQNTEEREVRNGAMEHDEHAKKAMVPGYPQDMMDMHGMHPESHLRKINAPLTRGMRADWHRGVEGLMTVLRVLPDDLYEKVLAGADVPDGASVPGAKSGKQMPMHHEH